MWEWLSFVGEANCQPWKVFITIAYPAHKYMIPLWLARRKSAGSGKDEFMRLQLAGKILFPRHKTKKETYKQTKKSNCLPDRGRSVLLSHRYRRHHRGHPSSPETSPPPWVAPGVGRGRSSRGRTCRQTAEGGSSTVMFNFSVVLVLSYVKFGFTIRCIETFFKYYFFSHVKLQTFSCKHVKRFPWEMTTTITIWLQPFNILFVKIIACLYFSILYKP